ncbi:MAG: ATP-binding protein [Chitinophagaceae bacterium]
MDKLPQQVLIIGISSVFLLIVAVGIILLVFIYQKRQLIYVREKEQLKVDFEKQILESKLEIQEQTFKNISQEIHDNIGQVLSLAKLTINTMNIEDTDTLPAKIDSSKQLISKAIEDLRNLSRNLNTDYITDLGLAVSIENEIRLLKNAATYQVDTVVTGEVYRLHHQQELIIFRIFQEVLQNIIRHSQASVIVVSFLYTPGIFSLQVSDNGKGFDINTLEQTENITPGIGVRNMRYRANLIAAEFTINSNLGKGTMIEIMLPVNIT